MKKFLLLSILAGLPLLCHAAWSPSVSASVLYHGTEVDSAYDTSGALRSSWMLSGEVNPLALRLGRHRLSAPLSLSYISESQVMYRTLVNERYEGILSVEYGYSFSGRFSLSASIDARLSFFPAVHSTLWRFGLTIKPAVRLKGHISLALPSSVVLGEAETAFICGLSISALWGGLE